ncbi:hypothetical protein [Moraxella bovis]|uniref:Uncharacterized protein n=1 Tax=Moraxella bovis TaxID=476 RepID=A0ABY6M357_MORBO|nr:hypothetical protein [Moraxella bovis]OOR87075.1 hypothetical protein B0182_13175 [Moraxella bovis]UZA02077.1 hypothetical protein LP092_08705 [Moraxella bovis]UZA18322.1 hypothetical protein LP088_08115 [Moraxella bovis]UZA36484.1 hypothetical protein LP098_05820 [Moraxella bovis]
MKQDKIIQTTAKEYLNRHDIDHRVASLSSIIIIMSIIIDLLLYGRNEKEKDYIKQIFEFAFDIKE